MPKFTPGTPKPANSGRRPGSKNKRTLSILELFDDNNFCPGQSLIDQLRDPEIEEKLNPKELADIHLKLMEFKFPRRKAVEHTGADGADLFNQLLKNVDGSAEDKEEPEE